MIQPKYTNSTQAKVGPDGHQTCSQLTARGPNMRAKFLPQISLLLLSTFVTIFADCSFASQAGPDLSYSSPRNSQISDSMKPQPRKDSTEKNIIVAKGPGIGNGGKGVMIEGKPYLLDLVEAGMEKGLAINSKVKVDSAIRERLAKAFAQFNRFPLKLAAQKLSEVQAADGRISILMLKTMEFYQWRLVNLPVKPIDNHREALDVNKSSEVQLASRLTSSIIINQQLWDQMNDANRVGLIFHEIIYAFAQPVKNQAGYFTQRIDAIQEATAFLLGTDLRGCNFLESRCYTTDNFAVRLVVPESFYKNFFPYSYFEAGSGDVTFDFEPYAVQSSIQAYKAPGKTVCKISSPYQTTPKKVEDVWCLTEEYADRSTSWEVISANNQFCRNLPAEGAFLRVDAKGTRMFLRLASIEVAPGVFSSYVDVKIVQTGGLESMPDPVTKETCGDVLKRGFDFVFNSGPAPYSQFKPINQ